MTAEVGTRVVHRRYVPYAHAHYAGNLVDGAYSLGLFGDVATELCIRTDGDEGLFASYSDVQFRTPVRAGDVLEISAEITQGRATFPRALVRRARRRPRGTDPRGARSGRTVGGTPAGDHRHRHRRRSWLSSPACPARHADYRAISRNSIPARPPR